jgi:hypothetical protein
MGRTGIRASGRHKRGESHLHSRHGVQSWGDAGTVGAAVAVALAAWPPRKAAGRRLCHLRLSVCLVLALRGGAPCCFQASLCLLLIRRGLAHRGAAVRLHSRGARRGAAAEPVRATPAC